MAFYSCTNVRTIDDIRKHNSILLIIITEILQIYGLVHYFGYSRFLHLFYSQKLCHVFENMYLCGLKLATRQRGAP